uniref:Uncharacterized protein n=1 Tax=uncultured bacterium fosmid pJB95A1 TaxID=1478075 RepID=A0A0H3U8H2_9BACT|nr:hypothetical protein [uncultured bacterium fosmid pJB95A1]
MDVQKVNFIGTVIGFVGLGQIQSSQEGFHAGQQFKNGEGFGDVVICSNFKSGHLACFFCLGGQHDDEGFRMLISDIAAYFETALLGNHQVQKNQVRLEFVHLLDGFVTIRSGFHDVVFQLEVVLQPQADNFFIFNN